MIGEGRNNLITTNREVRNDIITAAVGTFFATVAANIAAGIEARRTRFRVTEAFPAAVFMAKTRDVLIQVGLIDGQVEAVGLLSQRVRVETITAGWCISQPRATSPRTCVDSEQVLDMAKSFGNSLLPRVPQLGNHFYVVAPDVLEVEMLKRIITEDRRCRLTPMR